MDALSYKTKSASKATVTKEWVVVDADGHNLGRLASKVAMILRTLRVQKWMTKSTFVIQAIQEDKEL